MKAFFTVVIFLFFGFRICAQDTVSFLTASTEFHKQRFALASGVQAVGYGGSLGLLSIAWYKDYKQTSFHSFNDSREWLQMDKAGHLVTSRYLGEISTDMFEWSGVRKKKAVCYGALASFAYLTGIEVMDGFSGGWGFSWTDVAANSLGTGMMVGQKILSEGSGHTSFARGLSEISLKFSFHQTTWPDVRPSLLGDSVLARQILKDYNGQSYWMSFNISSFLKEDCKFPKWLNIALGYGGEGMISGKDEFVLLDNGNSMWVERYRQYYLSLDIDLTRINTRSHFLKTLFECISFIKIPSPSMEFSKKGILFHPYYF